MSMATRKQGVRTVSSAAAARVGGSPQLHITFHGIGNPHRPLEPGESTVWCSEVQLVSILDEFGGHPDIRITADDGNVSDLTILAPELAKRGLCGDFFILAGRIGDEGFLSEGNIRDLVAMGMRVGSHGWAHIPWRHLSEVASTREFWDARRRIEDVAGLAVVNAACPFGAYDRRTLNELEIAAYSRVYTSDGGWARPGRFAAARNSIGERCGADEIRRLLQHPKITWRDALRRAIKRWR